MTLVSLIISTYRRPALLEHMLESLFQQLNEKPAFPVEIIVVDNDVNANAKPMCERYIAASPVFRYVHENKTGLSFARNSGARAAKGEYLIFLDDDARAPMEYLFEVLDVLREYQPDIFGGPVLPWYTEGCPNWFPEEYEKRLHAAKSGWNHNVSLSGANFGIRKDVFWRLSGFDTHKGMVGAKLRFMEERALLDRYRRTTLPDHQRIYYIVDAQIEHMTPPARMQLMYQIKRQFQSHLERGRYVAANATMPLWRLRIQLIPYFIGGIAVPLSSFIIPRRKEPLLRKLCRVIISAAGRTGMIRGLLTAAKHKEIPNPTLKLGPLTVSVHPKQHVAFFETHCLSPYDQIIFSDWPGWMILVYMRFKYPWVKLECRSSKRWIKFSYLLLFDNR